MSHKNGMHISIQLVLILLCLLPLAILFLLPGVALLTGLFWFWALLLLTLGIVWLLLGRYSPFRARMVQPEMRMLYPEEQPDVVREVMDVKMASDETGVQIYRGSLRESAMTAYQRLKQAFAPATVPLLQQDEQHGAAIVLLPRSVEMATPERPVRPWIHLLLFGLTVVTTTLAGAAHQGVNLFQEPWRFPVGLPYSLALLAILGVHELGHYFTARHHGILVTPPYFIPIPFALGTFGAFIQMRSPTENRRALFDVAVAGPLAGLVIAIPALLIGLQSSVIVSGPLAGAGEAIPVLENTEKAPATIGGTSATSSILLALLAKLARPEALQGGCFVQLSPLAFAGWLGLFITALNLLPIGQLDGGHMSRAMFGTRTGIIVSRVAIGVLFLLGVFVWHGLLMWAILIYFIAGDPVPPLDDLTPLTPGRRWLGYLTFAILAMILIPLPQVLRPLAGIHCPYL